MLKSNWYFAVFSLVMMFGIISCCHEDDDDTCPDLIVQAVNTVDVACPGGFGTCVTTLNFTVENVGTADAGAFNIRIVLDPSSSVVLNEFVPAGLAAGDDLTITVVSPPGGNCYDPDCTATVTVDSDDDVSECDESNNELSETRLG